MVTSSTEMSVCAPPLRLRDFDANVALSTEKATIALVSHESFFRQFVNFLNAIMHTFFLQKTIKAHYFLRNLTTLPPIILALHKCRFDEALCHSNYRYNSMLGVQGISY